MSVCRMSATGATRLHHYCYQVPFKMKYSSLSAAINSDDFSIMPKRVKNSNLCNHLKVNPILISKRNISGEGLASYITTENVAIERCVQGLEWVHDTLGLPWWASIALTTLTLRASLTMPLVILQLKGACRLESIQYKIKNIATILKQDVAKAVETRKWDEETAKHYFLANMEMYTKKLYQHENYHPNKAKSMLIWFIPWLQVPPWIIMSLSYRNIAGFLPILGTVIPVLRPDMATEGCLWFPNLLMADTTMCLPIILGLTNLAITEMRVLKRENPAKLDRYISNFLRGYSVLMIGISSFVPSCLCWYWTCSASFGLIQNSLLCFPKVRRLLKLERTPSESQTPFKDMWAVAKKKYSFRSRTKNATDTDKDKK